MRPARSPAPRATLKLLWYACCWLPHTAAATAVPRCHRSMRLHPNRKRACAVRTGAARTSSGAAAAAPELDARRAASNTCFARAEFAVVISCRVAACPRPRCFHFIRCGRRSGFHAPEPVGSCGIWGAYCIRWLGIVLHACLLGGGHAMLLCCMCCLRTCRCVRSTGMRCRERLAWPPAEQTHGLGARGHCLPCAMSTHMSAGRALC